MQFESRYASGIADGSIHLTFRRWKRQMAVGRRRYRTAAGMIEVESITVVQPEDISDREAIHAGYESAARLLADLRGPAELPVYRVQFHALSGPDPRDELAADSSLGEVDLADIRARLRRLDVAGTGGRWTAVVLALIAANPGVRAADLAAQMGRETLMFKLDVRKLKKLGLTISLDTGYRLSPRGEAYMATSGGARNGESD